MLSLLRQFQKLKYTSPQPGVPGVLQGRIGIFFWGFMSLRLSEVLVYMKSADIERGLLQKALIFTQKKFF